MKKLLAIVASLLMVFAITGCNPLAHESDTVSDNLSREADRFAIPRRVIFFNGITDKYLLTIEGYCALGNNDPVGELTVICQTGPGVYKKHFLGLSDNVSYMVEQLDAAGVSKDHYLVVFRPETIVPDLQIR
jgi:hypothetical protein